MPITKCSVPNCSSTAPGTMHHCFSKRDDLRKIWLRNVKNFTLLCLNKKQIVQRKVCRKHFEQKFIITDSKISENAYPTLFTPVEIATGIPERSAENEEVWCHKDGTYCSTSLGRYTTPTKKCSSDTCPKSCYAVEPTSISCAPESLEHEPHSAVGLPIEIMSYHVIKLNNVTNLKPKICVTASSSHSAT